MGCQVRVLGENQFANGHFIEPLVGVWNFRRRHGVGDGLFFEVHHALHAGFRQIVNDAVGHDPGAVLPYSFRRVLYVNDFFIFKFLDGDIFQFLAARIVAARVEEMTDFSVLHIADDHVIRHAGVQIFLDFRVHHVLVFPIGPRHHVFIERHSADADEKCHGENRKRQPEEALAGNTHDDEFAGAREAGEAHERPQEHRHGEGVDHDARQGEDENLHRRHGGRTVLRHVAGDFEERIRAEEDGGESSHAK